MQWKHDKILKPNFPFTSNVTLPKKWRRGTHLFWFFQVCEWKFLNKYDLYCRLNQLSSDVILIEIVSVKTLQKTQGKYHIPALV